MTTLLDSRLSDRDFASHLLHVDDLLTWAKSKRLHLPTVPPIDVHEFVQVEALLFGIERDASNVTPEQALNIVLNDQVLKNDPVIQKYPDDIDPITCRWLLGVVAHRKWRELLSGAIAAHELELLDFGSKLPIYTAPVQSPATLPPVLAETTKERRARWLDWYGKGERGALQRVYERELLQNPKADRSFIGKEIDKANKEKAETERGGAMFGQLVQDGKRMG
jgi:hypothetical protein